MEHPLMSVPAKGLMRACISLFALLALGAAGAALAADPSQWDYQAVKFAGTEKAQTDKLNGLAADGWEFAFRLTNDTVCFRRPALAPITLAFQMGRNWQGKVAGRVVKLHFNPGPAYGGSGTLELQDERGRSTGLKFEYQGTGQPGPLLLGKTQKDAYGVVRFRKDGVFELRLNTYGPLKQPGGYTVLTVLKRP
jgi:hypothetical protein